MLVRSFAVLKEDVDLFRQSDGQRFAVFFDGESSRAYPVQSEGVLTLTLGLDKVVEVRRRDRQTLGY